MLAIDPESPGGPEILTLGTRPCPRPGPGEVLIKVAAAGVNRADLLQRMGRYPLTPGTPTILGLEAAGEVVATGAGVAAVQPGERVTVLLSGGGYAEYVAAPAAQCLPVPPGLSFAEAATLPETWCTVWSNLTDLAAAKPGDTLLLHGGTSGIGVTAIDYARTMGLTIIVTCGTEEKCQQAKRLGADHAINYQHEDFVSRVLELTAGLGADLVLDMIGGDYLGRNLSAMAVGGRHVSIAFQQGARPMLDLPMLMRKRAHLMGSFLRARSTTEKAAILAALRQRIWPLYEDGTLKPHLFRSFPLGQAAAAHRLLEAGGHIGKVALTLPG